MSAYKTANHSAVCICRSAFCNCAALRWARRSRRWPGTGLFAIVRLNANEASIEVRSGLGLIAARLQRDISPTWDLHGPAYGERLVQRQARCPRRRCLSRPRWALPEIAAGSTMSMARPIGAVVYRRRQHINQPVSSQTANTGRPRQDRDSCKASISPLERPRPELRVVTILGAAELAEFRREVRARMNANTEG